MNLKQAALPLAVTITVCLTAVPSQGQRTARTHAADKAAVTIDPASLDVHALTPAGPRKTDPQEGGIAGVPLVNECFNGFNDGPVSGQNGWTTFTATMLTPVVESTSPLEGAKGVNLPDDLAVANGTLNGIFSPNVGAQPDGQYTGRAKLMIPAVVPAPTAQYTVAFQAPSIVNPPPNPPGLITSRILFFPVDIQPQANVEVDPDNEPFDIIVLNDPDNAGPLPLVFVATGFEYTPGQMMDVRVELDAAANTQRYFINNTLIFTGTAYAGTRMEQAVVFSNSFQAAGEVGKTDCIAFEPGLPTTCPGDRNNSGAVDVDDLVFVILNWAQPDATGVVDVDDLVEVILHWGAC